jgi:hypothetical protein
VKAAVLAFTENYERETVSANSEDSDSDQKNPFDPKLRSFEDRMVNREVFVTGEVVFVFAHFFCFVVVVVAVVVVVVVLSFVC